MKFLYSLYEQQYFGIILFVLIVALLLLFLIIFFFGKKDEKIQLEKTRKLELANNNAMKDNNTEESFKEVDDNTKELVIPEIEQPKVVEEKPVELPTIENEEKIKEEIDINSLFELPSTEKVEEKPEEIILPEPQKVVEPIEVEKEIKPTVEAPFSSVFMEPKKEEKAPLEMPKLVEMPKLKEDTSMPKENNNNLFGVETEKENSIFNTIENETYDINEKHL